MKTAQILFPALLLALFSAFTLPAQTPAGMVKKTAEVVTTEQTETFKVLGNCGMCQKTIQKAATSAGAVKAAWDRETDMLTVTFDPAKTTVDAIQKAVAKAGYDNVGYKGDDTAYEELPGCCHYDRTGAAGGTKSCSEGDAAPKN